MGEPYIQKIQLTITRYYMLETGLCKYLIILFLVLHFSSCHNKQANQKPSPPTQYPTTDLQVDHLNIWVKNPDRAKEQLMNIGFRAIPDSLSQIHKGQGTTGRYFNFLNGYLELIFVYDEVEFAQNNKVNNQLDFEERAKFESNGASPFSLALKVKDYKLEKIPFEKVRYHQDWMEANSSIYAAKSSKTHIKAPSIFVVYPGIESDVFETLADLKNIPEEYAFYRDYFKHPNGAKKITAIIIRSTSSNLETETMQAVNGLGNVKVQNGTEHFMELYFDDHIQGKSFDLRPELPLVIHL